MPDAARSPLWYAGGGDASRKLANLQAEFARVLGVARVFVRHQGTEHFISRRPDDTLNRVGSGAGSGSPRYAWEDRGDGVLYGYLMSHD
jgi:hypothetical protein